MKLLVGLGNPGPDYQLTRHNTGFMVIDALALSFDIPFGNDFNCQMGRGRISGEEVVLVKPQTFVNQSGQAVAKLAGALQLPPSHILIIHDDVDLPLGKIRLKEGGGDGGHHGVKSVIDHLGNPNFIRLRVGIGRPLPFGDVTDYVLSPFSSEELEELSQVLIRAQEAIVCLIEEGLSPAMSKFNQ